jgi:hypothetical protein
MFTFKKLGSIAALGALGLLTACGNGGGGETAGGGKTTAGGTPSLIGDGTLKVGYCSSRPRQDRWRGSADYGTSTSSCYPGAPSIQARPRGMRRFRSAPRSSSQADQRCRTGGAVRAAGGVTCLR